MVEILQTLIFFIFYINLKEQLIEEETMEEKKVTVLRGTGDEGCQWVDVHYQSDGSGDIRVTHVGERIQTYGSMYATQDLDKVVGQKFSSPEELRRKLG